MSLKPDTKSGVAYKWSRICSLVRGLEVKQLRVEDMPDLEEKSFNFSNQHNIIMFAS